MPRAYLSIDDFKAGLDARRLGLAAPPGSLQVFQNGHINRGGEIEKAKKWVLTYPLPAGTFGLQSVNGGLYIFGSNSTPGGMPAGVTYQRLQTPDNDMMTKLVSTDIFSGAIYAVGQYGEGLQYHFYDADPVPDWYNGLIRPSMVNLDGTAAALAAEIDADPDVSASAVGGVITITAEATNTPFTITASVFDGGDFTDQAAVVATPTPASVGVAQVSTVTLGGTFDPGDEFTVTINDNVYGASSVTNEQVAVVLTHKNKMYAGSGVNLLFSVVGDPSLWRDNTVGSTINTGSGVIDMSAQASSEEDITGLGVYQNSLGIFTRNLAQIWSMDADPAASVQLQVLDHTGTRSPKTIKSFGDLDVFFLSDSGVRSLRARDSSNSASVTDVGTPVDDLIIAAMSEMTDAQIVDIPADIEPKDGRYILPLLDTQYVFTFFPTSKISAWSTYAPGISITDFTAVDGRLYGRAGDNIYLLGGEDDDEYTDEEVVVEIPYLDARTIGTWKGWRGLDLILTGTWDVYVNTNPNQPDVWIKTARVTKSSIGQMNLAMQQYSPVIKFKFVHQEDDTSISAKISKIIVHYETTWAG
jgi:hypothetical protein